MSRWTVAITTRSVPCPPEKVAAYRQMLGCLMGLHQPAADFVMPPSGLPWEVRERVVCTRCGAELSPLAASSESKIELPI